MRRISEILKNKQGMAYFEACFWIVFLATVLSLCLLYASLFTVIQNTQDDVRSVLDEFITSKTTQQRDENANSLKVVFDSLKNGNDYTQTFTSGDAGELERQLEAKLAAEINSGSIKKADGEGSEVFTITGYKVNFDEENEFSENTLKLKVDYKIHIPVIFRGTHITTIELDQKIIGYYNPKFGNVGS